MDGWEKSQTRDETAIIIRVCFAKNTTKDNPNIIFRQKTNNRF